MKLLIYLLFFFINSAWSARLAYFAASGPIKECFFSISNHSSTADQYIKRIVINFSNQNNNTEIWNTSGASIKISAGTSYQQHFKILNPSGGALSGYIEAENLIKQKRNEEKLTASLVCMNYSQGESIALYDITYGSNNVTIRTSSAAELGVHAIAVGHLNSEIPSGWEGVNGVTTPVLGTVELSWPTTGTECSFYFNPSDRSNKCASVSVGTDSSHPLLDGNITRCEGEPTDGTSEVLSKTLETLRMHEACNPMQSSCVLLNPNAELLSKFVYSPYIDVINFRYDYLNYNQAVKNYSQMVKATSTDAASGFIEIGFNRFCGCKTVTEANSTYCGVESTCNSDCTAYITTAKTCTYCPAGTEHLHELHQKRWSRKITTRPDFVIGTKTVYEYIRKQTGIVNDAQAVSIPINGGKSF